MSADKLVTLYGLTGKTEASYKAGGALALTDGILLAEPANMTIDFVHDGARAPNPGNSGQARRAKPSGASGAFAAKIEAAGAGATYSASVLAQVLHTLMRISGHGATLDSTAGAQKYTFAPVSSGFASGVLNAYARGQLYPLTGAYADFSFSFDGPGFLMMEFAVQGLIGAVSDVSVPAITYPNHAVPPKCENIALSIGGTSFVVRKGSFKANRKISPRADVNAAGHAGFTLGTRAPTLELTVEAKALATFNPYTLRENGTVQAVTFTVGGTQFNRLVFTASQAQITGVTEEADEDTALWTLAFALSTSGPAAEDDYSLVLS